MNIRRIVKRNKLLSKVAYFVREKRSWGLIKRYSKQPIESKVFFYRSGGGYGDNPRAVAEYLHKNFPEIKLVWACGSDFFFPTIPEYVKPVVFESEECYKEIATAGAWVCSTTLPNGTLKREGQLYIQTWHGDKFLKKIGNDSAADVDSYKWRQTASKFCEAKICDYFVTGCEWFVPVAASAFDYKGAFLRTGMPRNDCLVNMDEEKCRIIKKAVGVPMDVNVLIYAPTFRDYEKTHDTVGSQIDLCTILDSLEKKYSCKWICLMRAHAGRQLKLGSCDILDSRFKDVTLYPDMADLLMISDMLISDYSSCGADFAITGKMVLMYQDDIDQYTTRGRTLYFSRKESPYFTAYNMEEALGIIERVTEEDIRANSKGILDFYDSFETGHACEEVSKVIVEALAKIKLR